MLKELLDGYSTVSGEAVAASGLAKLAGIPQGSGKSLPAAMNELTARRRDEAAMRDRIRARRRTAFAGDELGTMQKQHEINKRLDAAEAALVGGNYGGPDTD